MAEPTLQDWLAARDRLLQGRTYPPGSTAAPETLSVPPSALRQFFSNVGATFTQNLPVVGSLFDPPVYRPNPQEGVQAIPLGAVGDPVSQLAFAAAPYARVALRDVGQGVDRFLVTGGKVPLAQVGQYRGAERGNLGSPPRSASGELLPESVVRDEQGQLKRLYHGTPSVFADFDPAFYGKGAGGDLYGPGIYMTESPAIAGGGPEARDPFQLNYASRNLSSRGLMDMQAREREALVQGDRSAAQYWRQQIEQDVQRTASSNVRPVYADLKNPFDASSPLTEQEARRVRIAINERLATLQDGAVAEALRDWRQTVEGGRISDPTQMIPEAKALIPTILQQAGYDGITHIGGAVTGGQPHRVYVSFSPDQVYPSFNVDALRQPASPAGGPP